jgi:hypothetical protein
VCTALNWKQPNCESPWQAQYLPDNTDKF